MPKGRPKNPIEVAKKISEAHKKRTDIEIGKYFNCLVCGSQFWRKPYAIKKGDNKFCSKKCYFKWQKGKNKIIRNPYDRSGNNNPNWRGGVRPIHLQIRASKEMEQWRNEVFKRDNWACQDCGRRSSKNEYLRIEGHHIKPFALFPELRFVIDNGKTLCKKCHDKKPKGREILCLK